MSTPDYDEVEAIAEARHGDPFAILGPHDGQVRAFIPDAEAITVCARDDGRALGELRRTHPGGFWTGTLSEDAPYRLHITGPGWSYETEDPYSFPLILGEMDIYLLGEGRHRDFAHALGAHVTTMDGVKGVRFAVWAPGARRVSVVGPFNNWDGRRHPMRARLGAGVWELFIPRLQAGTLYKYEIVSPTGETLPLKADPVAWAAEIPPATASIVADPAIYPWHDEAFLASRAARQSAGAPISIYEMHAASWMPAAEQGGYGWTGLAEKLVPYVRALGFTHIELLPVMEHPFGGSWGYQPLGQFAPNSRLGPPAEFAAFVAACHEAEIGVILDWVPAHFPTDAHGLARFDGTPLYEHADPRRRISTATGIRSFLILGATKCANFLLANAMFWLQQYHIGRDCAWMP